VTATPPPPTAAPTKTRNLNREIERLFTQKVKIFGALNFNRSSPLFGLFKVLLKCWLEETRMAVLTRLAYEQLQIDAYCVRRVVYETLGSADTTAGKQPAAPIAADGKQTTPPDDDVNTLNVLLDEVLSGAADRCVDSNASTLEQSVIDRVLTASVTAPTDPAATTTTRSSGSTTPPVN